jgi:uncharacterized lipoprotein YajG
MVKVNKMKKILLIGLIIILVSSALLVACSPEAEITEDIDTSNPETLTEDQAIVADIDQELLSEEDVDIGEMI